MEWAGVRVSVCAQQAMCIMPGGPLSAPRWLDHCLHHAGWTIVCTTLGGPLSASCWVDHCPYGRYGRPQGHSIITRPREPQPACLADAAVAENTAPCRIAWRVQAAQYALARRPPQHPSPNKRVHTNVHVHAGTQMALVGYFDSSLEAMHARDCAAMVLPHPVLNMPAPSYTLGQVMSVVSVSVVRWGLEGDAQESQAS